VGLKNALVNHFPNVARMAVQQLGNGRDARRRPHKRSGVAGDVWPHIHRLPAFGAMLPDRTVWELVAYIKSISEKPGPTFGTTTSLQPQSPNIEQVSQNRLTTATPWKFTEPMPQNGQEPGKSKGNELTAALQRNMCSNL
jgi:hypothetical protein